MIAALFVLLLQQGSPAARAPNAVQLGVLVRPETVTVGEHFVTQVRVRASRGAAIAFPVGPDSGLGVDAVDPRVVRATPDSTATDQTASYRLAAWDTGAQRIVLGDVVVTSPTGDRRVPLGRIVVYVRSVLPADTSLRVPKPWRDILEAPRPWWPLLLAALALLALIGFLIWWWRRRRRVPAPVTDALTEAEREFARIDALRLVEAGERGRFVALNVEVMRDYLARRVDAAVRSLTSSELLGAVGTRGPVPAERLAPLLAEADLVKFARRPVTAERARELAAAARSIVRETERAVIAAEAAASGEKAA